MFSSVFWIKFSQPCQIIFGQIISRDFQNTIKWDSQLPVFRRKIHDHLLLWQFFVTLANDIIRWESLWFSSLDSTNKSNCSLWETDSWPMNNQITSELDPLDWIQRWIDCSNLSIIEKKQYILSNSTKFNMMIVASFSRRFMYYDYFCALKSKHTGILNRFSSRKSRVFRLVPRSWKRQADSFTWFFGVIFHRVVNILKIRRSLEILFK